MTERWPRASELRRRRFSRPSATTSRAGNGRHSWPGSPLTRRAFRWPLGVVARAVGHPRLEAHLAEQDVKRAELLLALDASVLALDRRLLDLYALVEATRAEVELRFAKLDLRADVERAHARRHADSTEQALMSPEGPLAGTFPPRPRASTATSCTTWPCSGKTSAGALAWSRRCLPSSMSWCRRELRACGAGRRAGAARARARPRPGGRGARRPRRARSRAGARVLRRRCRRVPRIPLARDGRSSRPGRSSHLFRVGAAPDGQSAPDARPQRLRESSRGEDDRAQAG